MAFNPSHGRRERNRQQHADVDDEQNGAQAIDQPQQQRASEKRRDGKQDDLSLASSRHHEQSRSFDHSVGGVETTDPTPMGQLAARVPNRKDPKDPSDPADPLYLCPRNSRVKSAMSA